MNSIVDLTSDEALPYLEEEILERIETIVSDCERGDIDTISARRMTGTIGTRPIFHFTLSCSAHGALFQKEIIVKSVKDEFDVNEVFREHRKLWEGYRAKNVRPIVPEPYFCVEKENLLAMSYERGTSLLKKVLRSLVFRRSSSCRDTFTELGTSLATFHELGQGEKGPEPLRSIIEDARELLKDADHLPGKDRQAIEDHLQGVAEGSTGDTLVPISRNYNDWTMRNFLIDDSGTLTLLDTDAMTHPHFSRYDMIWNDVMTFIMNLESQTRYSPLVGRSDICSLKDLFLEGYLTGFGKVGSQKRINDLLYVAALRIYLSRTRPFRNKFSGRVSGRYLREFETSLLRGSGTIFG